MLTGRAPRQHLHLPLEQVVPDRVVVARILGLFGLEPVVAHAVRFLERGGEYLCRKVRQTGKILFGLCKCSHIVADDTIIDGRTQMPRA